MNPRTTTLRLDQANKRIAEIDQELARLGYDPKTGTIEPRYLPSPVERLYNDCIGPVVDKALYHMFGINPKEFSE